MFFSRLGEVPQRAWNLHVSSPVPRGSFRFLDRVLWGAGVKNSDEVPFACFSSVPRAFGSISTKPLPNPRWQTRVCDFSEDYGLEPPGEVFGPFQLTSVSDERSASSFILLHVDVQLPRWGVSAALLKPTDHKREG